MKRVRFASLFAIAALASATVASDARAAIILSDDFESYANTAEMTAVWTGAVGTLSSDQAYSGSQSMRHTGTTANIYNLSADIIPTDANPVILSGRIYDDGVRHPQNGKRYTIGFRSLATFPLFEMGMYNTIAGQTYAARINGFPGGGSPDWVGLGAGPAVVGWHTFTGTFTGSSVDVTVDLTSDGTIDGQYSFNLAGSYAAAGLGSIRLGGPVSDSSGGGYFDDILLQVVPEPATLALAGMGLVGLVAARRRLG